MISSGDDLPSYPPTLLLQMTANHHLGTLCECGRTLCRGSPSFAVKKACLAVPLIALTEIAVHGNGKSAFPIPLK